MNTNTIALTKNLVIAMEEAIASIDAGMHLGASVTLGEALWKNRAAIAALEAQPTGWMPIESAPKDKVLLLGYFNAAGKWAACAHEFKSSTVANCLTRYTCTKCGKAHDVDSSD